MASHLRAMMFFLLFGMFMSNNIIVPVHELSHIYQDHPSDVVNCDAFHALQGVAITSADFVACLPSLSKSVNTPATAPFIVFTTTLSAPIRAPPAYA